MADLSPADEGWEARMAARARQRRLDGDRLSGRHRTDDFSVYREPGDPDDVLPQILAARCLGIDYGNPGPWLPPESCWDCWGERHVWLGNAWGVQHVKPSPYPAVDRLFDCGHACHEGEMWLA